MAENPLLQRLPPLEGHEERANQLLTDFDTFVRGTKILPDYCVLPHKEMCDEMEQCLPDFETSIEETDTESLQKKKIYLAPRYSYKTSILVAFVVFCFLKFANIRITLGRATSRDAKDTLSKVKSTFLLNAVIKEVWGDVSEDNTTWTTTAITHGFRTVPLQEPTIQTAGIGQSQTGTHPDLVLLDDLVTEVNYRSELSILRTRDWVTSWYPIMGPRGSMLVCGTRWAYNDIYIWLMDQDDQAEEDIQAEALAEGHDGPPDQRQWTRYIRTVESVDDNGKVVYFFPSKLNAAFLANQKRLLSKELVKFYSWYYQQPHEKGVKLFMREDIRHFEGYIYHGFLPSLAITGETSEDLFPVGTEIPVNVSMTIDPAPTSGKRADFTGITAVACDYAGNWWILHGEGVRKTPSDLADYISMLIGMYGVNICCIETGQADPEFVSRLQSKLSDMTLKCSIVSYSAIQDEGRGGRAKETRIEAMQYLFADRKVWIRRGAQTRDLLAQLDGWPTIDKDDVIDALSMQRHVVMPSELKNDQDFSGLLEEIEEFDSWGPNGKPAPVEPVRAKSRTPSGCRTGIGTMSLKTVW